MREKAPKLLRHIQDSKIITQSYPHIVLPRESSGSVRLVPKICTSFAPYQLANLMNSQLDITQKIHFIPDYNDHGGQSYSDVELKLAPGSVKPFESGPILGLAMEKIDPAKPKAKEVSHCDFRSFIFAQTFESN